MKDELLSNPALKVATAVLETPAEGEALERIKGVKPAGMFDLHREMNGLQVQWSAKAPAKAPADVAGATKIQAVEKVLRDWEGVVYFDSTPANARIRHFHPIDFFVDEASVGAFLSEKGRADSSLYLYRFEGEPDNLHLDVHGYLEMLIASRCFLYWQYAILEIIQREENPVSSRFKEWMPKLFPGFDWKEYVEQYGKVRLSST